MKQEVNVANLARPRQRRQSARFLLAAAVRFEWRAMDGEWHKAVGSTRNISKAGAFIETGTLPPIGSAVRMVATLPTKWTADGVLRLRGAGDVRHVRQIDTVGFGASVVLRLEVLMAKS